MLSDITSKDYEDMMREDEDRNTWQKRLSQTGHFRED